MAGDNEKLSFEIDLDAKEMLEGLHSIQEQLEHIGSGKEFEGLTAGLVKVTKAAGVMAAAFLAAKTSMETIFEAEKIKQVNAQFESLAANAGLAATRLKEGLVGASKGMIDDTDILKSANKALVEMGGNAEKLPEIMELARKSGVIMGGDVLERFEAINHAIATGSQKQLKNLGIQVDVNKAYEKYADSIGVTVGQLTEEAKHTALLNEVLEVNKKRYADVNEGLTEATNTWKQLIAVLKQVAEVATLVFDKVFGPKIRELLGGVRDIANDFKTKVVAAFGDGAEQAAAKQEILHDSLQQYKAQLIDLEQEQMKFAKGSAQYEGIQKNIDRVRGTVESLEKQYAAAKEAVAEYAEEEKKTAEERKSLQGSPELVDKTKVLADQAKFQNSLRELHEQRLNSQIATTKSWSEQESLSLEKIELENEKHAQKLNAIRSNKDLNASQKRKLEEAEEEAHYAKIAELEAKNLELKTRNIEAGKMAALDEATFNQYMLQQEQAVKEQYAFQLEQLKQNEELTDQQRKQRQIELEMQTQAEITRIHADAFAQRDALIQRSVYQSNNAAEQFAAGFVSGSRKAANELSNFGKQGQYVFTSLSSHASNAFMQIGEGSKKGSAILREAMLGTIADVAQYYGQMMLAAGIFPPNPPALAGGAALLVLAGYLRSQAKGSAGGMAMSGGGYGGGGGGDFASVATTPAQSNLMQQQAQQAKSVHLEVHGSIMDSDQTRQRITQLVRDSMDATDFSIARVGGGV